MLLLAADTPSAALRSNFRIDQAALVESVGAVAERVHGPDTAMADVARAVRRARVERRAVVLMLPLDVQAGDCDPSPPAAGPELAPPPRRRGGRGGRRRSCAPRERPAIVAGRGAVLAGAGPALRRLGERTGAVLATSAVANGLFAGDPYAVGIAGGFSSPTAARLLGEADVGDRVRRRAEPVDDAPRHADRADGGSSRSTATRRRSARTGRSSSASSATPPRPPRRCSPRSTATMPRARGPPALADEIAAGAWRHDPYEESTTPSTRAR